VPYSELNVLLVCVVRHLIQCGVCRAKINFHWMSLTKCFTAVRLSTFSGKCLMKKIIPLVLSCHINSEIIWWLSSHRGHLPRHLMLTSILDMHIGTPHINFPYFCQIFNWLTLTHVHGFMLHRCPQFFCFSFSVPWTAH
jgi:hypothetical protein